jgi:acyl-coenzyme A thioesterase 9
VLLPWYGSSFSLKTTFLTATEVSLDPATKRPVAIAPLKATSPAEERLFAQGQANYDLKKSLASQALRKQTPNDEESDLIHALWLAQLDYRDPSTSAHKPSDAVYMSSTTIHSVQIMQPQFRNRHNFMIFGGFLLKSTFELAFTCASATSHTRPTFIALDPSTFLHPVPVGSVLYLTATVAYSDSPLVPAGEVKASPEGSSRIQIRVDSKVRDIEHGVTKPTGTFSYTFEVKKEIKVIPETYAQYMLFLDARRKYQLSGGMVERKKGGVME